MKSLDERIMNARSEHDYFLRLNETTKGIPKPYNDRSDMALERCIMGFIHYTGGQSIAFTRGGFSTIHAYINGEKVIIDIKTNKESAGTCPAIEKDRDEITCVTVHSAVEFFAFYEEYFKKP